MYLAILCLPLFGFLGAACFGRWLGRRGACLLTSGCLASSCLLAWLIFYEVGLCQSPSYVNYGEWFHVGMFDASWGFLFDTLTGVMLIVVTTVSLIVHVYSIDYMSEDPHGPRFMSYLSLFTFFMLMLVTGDNFLQIFFGWEGVGVASYLLINFWFTRLQANKSAIKAMLMNRIGDLGFALGIFGLYGLFQTVHIPSLLACASTQSHTPFLFLGFSIQALDLFCIFLFIGAVGKSAQLGLHTWLPDAMEGPTPVSALIHAATMVTAGVFLLGRISPLLEYAPLALTCVTIVGGMTCFFAATTGLVQNDLKRVIAYSTCSQLGYMVFACGLSHYSIGLFHLMNHAFFKALLFLGAGSVLHAVADEQDMRRMGGLSSLLPYTYAFMVGASLALTGFPFLTGFYSKDVLLEVAYTHYSFSGNFAYSLGLLAALCTSFYSSRLLALTFLGRPKGFRNQYKSVHDAPFFMGFPLLVLAFGSVMGGFLAKDLFLGDGTDFWGQALWTLPERHLGFESEWIPQSIKLLPFFISLFGLFLGSEVVIAQYAILYKWVRSLYAFLNQRWLFDQMYTEGGAKLGLSFGYKISFRDLDKGFFEHIGPTFFIQTFPQFVRKISWAQTGFVYHYALAMLIGLLGFLSFSFLSYWSDPLLFGLLFFFLLFCEPWLDSSSEKSSEIRDTFGIHSQNPKTI